MVSGVQATRRKLVAHFRADKAIRVRLLAHAGPAKRYDEQDWEWTTFHCPSTLAGPDAGQVEEAMDP
jgi:hypothetical protein